jgi:hypothetical protein
VGSIPSAGTFQEDRFRAIAKLSGLAVGDFFSHMAADSLAPRGAGFLNLAEAMYGASPVAAVDNSALGSACEPAYSSGTQLPAQMNIAGLSVPNSAAPADGFHEIWPVQIGFDQTPTCAVGLL